MYKPSIKFFQTVADAYILVIGITISMRQKKYRTELEFMANEGSI